MKTLLILWLVGMLAPLFALSFYAHPAHDDFPHILPAAEAWARTGDVLQTLQAAWGRMADMYRTWQGTWVAMLSSALQPMAFSPRLFFLTPLWTLAALCLSAAYFVKALATRTLRMDGLQALALYAAFMTYLLQFLPSVRETIYWQSGTPYTLSLVALLLTLGLLLKLRAGERSALYAWRSLALLACGAVLGGSPYPLALGGAVGLALVAAWCLARRSKASVGSLCALAGVAGSLVAVLLAPGNAVRQTRVGEPLSAPLAIALSLEACARQSGQWFSPQLAALCAAVALLVWEPLKRSGLRFRRPALFTLLSAGVLAASFVPPIFATGRDGYLTERVLASLFMLFALLALLNAVYWAGYAAVERGIGRPCRRGAPVGVALACLALFVLGLFSVSVNLTPSLSAAKDIALGNARRYDAEMTLREERLEAAEGRQEAIDSVVELSVAPPDLPVDMLPYQKDGDLPRLMHRYYRVARLAEQYGAGRIPPDAWEEAEAWSE